MEAQVMVQSHPVHFMILAIYDTITMKQVLLHCIKLANKTVDCAEATTSSPSPSSSSVDEKASRNLKFIHSKFVIALVAPEFLSSWMARNYF
jgi:hypothetical protein